MKRRPLKSLTLDDIIAMGDLSIIAKAILYRDGNRRVVGKVELIRIGLNLQKTLQEKKDWIPVRRLVGMHSYDTFSMVSEFNLVGEFKHDNYVFRNTKDAMEYVNFCRMKNILPNRDRWRQ